MAHVILLNFLSTITSTITTATNQDHKKKIHAQVHKKYPGKPFSTREENPANPLLYSSRERPPTPSPKLAHKRVLQFS
jgi:hypothetical protein